jgi:ubiquinone biosynthesis monooxygenase Coq7
MNNRLPGDLSKEAQLARMIRVNHAGEFGAKRIYAGQLAVLGDDPALKSTLTHMAKQEDEHYAYFCDELVKRGIRPTALSPLWHIAGFALGAGTALLGKEAAMACTVAVEEVIDAHYAEQLTEIANDEPELASHIARFREEELEHRDIGLEHHAERTPGYEVLCGVVKGASRLAIWLSKRV